MVNGIAQRPIEGVSMAYTWDKANADAPSDAQDAVLRDVRQPRPSTTTAGIACTTPPAPPWLMGTAKLPETWSTATSGSCTTSRGLLAVQRSRGEESRTSCERLQELFLVEATKYNVFPLDNSVLPRLLTPRPSATAGRTEFTYSGEMPGCPIATPRAC